MKCKLFTLLLAGLLLTGCGQSSPQEDNSSQTPTSEETPYIVSFEATTIDGQELTSDCFGDSKLTMLNVWATYCNPCLSEMPDLGEIAGEYALEDFQLIGIVSDVIEGADEDSITEAMTLIEETNAAYPHLLLNQSLYSNLVGAVDSVPTSFFINQKGELLGYVVGAKSKDTWIEIIDDLSAEME